MQSPKSPYTQYRLRITVGFSLMALMLLTLLIWHAYTGFQSDRNKAISETRIFAQGMSAHVLSAIETADLSLKASVAALAALEPESMPSREKIKSLLAPAERTPDANFWGIFIGRDGRGIVASNGLGVEGVQYGDRPYFSHFTNAPDDDLFVGGPELGRVSHRRLFFLSRRVVSAAGQFLGVVVAPMDASMVAGVFSKARFDPFVSIALLDSGGKIIARAPKFEAFFGSTVQGQNLTARVRATPSGSFEATSPIDGIRRIFSYNAVGALPLVVFVGMANDSWTTGIKDDLIAAVASLCVILMVMVFSGRFALRSFRRLEESQVSQRRLIEELRDARDELVTSEKRIRLITDNMPALIFYMDVNLRYVFHNAQYCDVQRLAPSLIGKTVREALGEEIHAAVENELARALRGERVSFERTLRAEGRDRHLKFEYTPDMNEAGKVIGVFGMVTDISDMKLVQEKLTNLARLDALTGLPNRVHLYERLREAIDRARRSGSALCCLYLDIDHFKDVNDCLGHAGGDSVLKQFGERLRGCVRQSDMVARLAGDEFVIVLESLDQPSDAHAAAAKIIATMDYPFVVNGHSRLITTSIGVVIATPATDLVARNEHEPDLLLKKADAALYSAKRAGRNGFAIYGLSDAHGA